MIKDEPTLELLSSLKPKLNEIGGLMYFWNAACFSFSFISMAFSVMWYGCILSDVLTPTRHLLFCLSSIHSFKNGTQNILDTLFMEPNDPDRYSWSNTTDNTEYYYLVVSHLLHCTSEIAEFKTH